MPILDLANNIIFKSFAKLNFKFNQKYCTTCLSDFLYDESSMKNSILILECNHVFHLTCTITYIKHKLAENIFNIKCPLCSKPIKKDLVIKILNTYNQQLIEMKQTINNVNIKNDKTHSNDND